MTGRLHTTNDARLNKEDPVEAKGCAPRSWTSGGYRVSVMTREDAGVDSDEPWVASCDEHHEMICCATKASATHAARYRDWCSRCREAAAINDLLDNH